MIKNAIKKSLVTSLFLSLTSLQVASANIFSSSSNQSEMNGIGLQLIGGNSMYLGEWSHQISAKLNPSYFNQLDRLKNTLAFSQNSHSLITNFITTSSHFRVSAFSESLFNKLSDDSHIYFSFSTKNIKLDQQSLSGLQSRFNSQQLKFDGKANKNFVEQEFYAPGYVYSTGNSSIGVGILLVQQKFLDDSFGSVVLGGSFNSNFYDKNFLFNTNKGTGYQFNVSQKLSNRIDVSFDYQSQVVMNEFGSTDRAYSNPGDFDIPREYTVSLGMNILESSKINFTAKEIAFNSIDPFVHSGYSQSFLNAYNNPISPIFKLDDLTVYSVNFNQEINDRLKWNMDISSRQQAPATKSIYNNILNTDTASVSYKLGVSYESSFGQLDLFTSFANKPLLIGSNDFGRSSNSVLSNHFEGVASWSFQF